MLLLASSRSALDKLRGHRPHGGQPHHAVRRRPTPRNSLLVQGRLEPIEAGRCGGIAGKSPHRHRAVLLARGRRCGKQQGLDVHPVGRPAVHLPQRRLHAQGRPVFGDRCGGRHSRRKTLHTHLASRARHRPRRDVAASSWLRIRGASPVPWCEENEHAQRTGDSEQRPDGDPEYAHPCTPSRREKPCRLGERQLRSYP